MNDILITFFIIICGILVLAIVFYFLLGMILITKEAIDDYKNHKILNGTACEKCKYKKEYMEKDNE